MGWFFKKKETRAKGRGRPGATFEEDFALGDDDARGLDAIASDGPQVRFVKGKDNKPAAKTNTKTNALGQPLNARFNQQAVLLRSVNEMLGICKGVLADGEVNAAEATALNQWMEANPSCKGDVTLRRLAERLGQIFADGEISAEELQSLKTLLQQVTGMDGGPAAARKPTSEGFDDPPPLVFPGKTFCLTGEFTFGTRDGCHAAILERGGLLHKNPTRKTDYLVVGTGASRDWVNTTYGRKIEKVLEDKRNGKTITAIVQESHWQEYL